MRAAMVRGEIPRRPYGSGASKQPPAPVRAYPASMTTTADADTTGYTATQRAGAILAMIGAACLLLILADVATGGRLFGKAGCGCEEDKTDDS